MVLAAGYASVSVFCLLMAANAAIVAFRLTGHPGLANRVTRTFHPIAWWFRLGSFGTSQYQINGGH
jgi:hypothetical protein